MVGILQEREVDVMVYLLVGSENATKWYAEQAIQAGVAFVNAIPVFIGREPYWQRFAEAGLPIIGDDIKSQVGATITHRVLTRLFMDRGVQVDRTYQLNFGATPTSPSCSSASGWSRRRSPRRTRSPPCSTTR